MNLKSPKVGKIKLRNEEEELKEERK